MSSYLVWKRPHAHLHRDSNVQFSIAVEAFKEFMVDEEEAFGTGSEGVPMDKFIFVFILYVLVWALQ